MKLNVKLIGATVSVLLLSFAVAPSQSRVTGWRSFVSRGSWRIQYPATWITGSCHSCPDTRAPDVYVDFVPPHSKESDGWVMVSPLANKPSTISLDAWFAEVESSANQNPETGLKSFVLNGLPAHKVRYINKGYPDGGLEMEAVYVVSGSRRFPLRFPVITPDALKHYPIFPFTPRWSKASRFQGAVASEGSP